MQIYKTNKKIITVLTISCFLLVLITSSFNASGQSNQYNDKDSELNDYIIEFKEDTILSFKNKISSKFEEFFSKFNGKIANKFYNNNIQIHKNKLITLQEKAKKDIIKILEIDASPEKIFSNNFMMLFNGISIKNIRYDQVQKIKNLPYVKNVIPNMKIYAKLDESIPLINADDVWRTNDSYGYNVTGKGVTFAILDTGVDYNHPDLKDNYISEGSYDFVNNDTDPMDDHFKSHGTHCAGIVCGNGNQSNQQYVGVAPDAKFYAFKILDQDGEGTHDAFFAGFEAAIDPNGDLDTSDHVDIISISFGTDSAGSPDDPLSKMADAAVEEGIVVVAAAGNSGPISQTISSPGCARKAICVGSSTKDDKLSLSSSRGPVELNGSYFIKPDIVAPGVDIYSTKIGGDYLYMSGTSMAVPHVAGAAALLLQAKPELKGKPDIVKNILKDSAVDLYYDSNEQGSGRLDIARALDLKEEIIIDAPSEIVEELDFTVKIFDASGKPINVLVILRVPFHFPRIRFGNSIVFNAPTIYRNHKDVLLGEIIVYKLFESEKNWKKDIIIKNT